MVGKTKLYKILDELINVGLLISNTKRLGPNKGSLTNLSIDLEKLQEAIDGKLTYSKKVNHQDEKPLPKKEIKTPPVEEYNTSTNETYETTFINNAGEELNVDQKHIKFFNEIVLKNTNNKYFYRQLEKATGDYTLNIVLQEWFDEYQQRNINYEIN